MNSTKVEVDINLRVIQLRLAYSNCFVIRQTYVQNCTSLGVKVAVNTAVAPAYLSHYSISLGYSSWLSRILRTIKDRRVKLGYHISLG